MGVAFEEDDILPAVCRRTHRRLGVAKLQGNRFVDVGTAVNGLLATRDGVRDRHEAGQGVELYLDQVERVIGDPLVGRGDGGDRIADVAHLLASQRLLILADRENAEFDRQVISGEDGEHAGQGPRPGGVDAENAGMRMRAAQNPSV